MNSGESKYQLIGWRLSWCFIISCVPYYYLIMHKTIVRLFIYFRYVLSNSYKHKDDGVWFFDAHSASWWRKMPHVSSVVFLDFVQTPARGLNTGSNTGTWCGLEASATRLWQNIKQLIMPISSLKKLTGTWQASSDNALLYYIFPDN